MSRKKSYTTVGIEISLYERAKDAARKDDRSFSSFVEKVLRKYIGLGEPEEHKDMHHAD